nr:hypothetical protein HmN_000203300 [Hymenolepis microstoma]
MNEIFKDTSVADLYQTLAFTSTNDPFEDAVSFLDFLSSKVSEECILKLRLKASTFTSEAGDSSTIERQMKFLLFVQFEYSKSLVSSDNISPNEDLADWASEILERMRICSNSQSGWKNFIRYNLVEKFKNTHRKTLSLIYSNLGLKRPMCLPRLSDDEGESSEKENDGPKDGEDNPELSVNTVEEKSSRPSLESCSRRSNESSILSQSCCSDPNQRVLMPTVPRSSLKHKRKSTNPVKRLSLPASKSSGVVDKRKKSSQRKTSNSQKSALRKRRPSGGGKEKKQESIVQKTGGEEKDESCSPLHPSVTETPNPKASFPRWERARMAAAAKIKDKKVIVAESPLKPSSENVIGSPLRRLRRASSFLNFGGVNEASQSSSYLGARAERYQRRLQEEETSLSQFSGGESNSQCTQPLSASNSCSDLRRRSSNLLINFASPKTPNKPTLQSVVSSPSILTTFKRKSVRPFRHLFGDDPTSSTALERRESASKRQRVELEGGSISQPIIPGEFSENAMFLGEDEFLLHTNTPPRMRTRGMDTHMSPRRDIGVLSSPTKGEGGVPISFKTPTKNLRSTASMRQASEQENQSGTQNRRAPTRSQSLLSHAQPAPKTPTRILRSGLAGQRETSALGVPTGFQTRKTPTRSQSLLSSARPESPLSPKTPKKGRHPGSSLRSSLRVTPEKSIQNVAETCKTPVGGSQQLLSPTKGRVQPIIKTASQVRGPFISLRDARGHKDMADHQAQESSETHRNTRKRLTAQLPSKGGNQSAPKTPIKKLNVRSPTSLEAGTSRENPSEADVPKNVLKRSEAFLQRPTTRRRALSTQIGDAPDQSAREEGQVRKTPQKCQQSTLEGQSESIAPSRRRTPLKAIPNAQDASTPAEHSEKRTPRKSLEGHPYSTSRKRAPMSCIDNLEEDSADSAENSENQNDSCDGSYLKQANCHLSSTVDTNSLSYDSPSSSLVNNSNSFNSFVQPFPLGNNITYSNDSILVAVGRYPLSHLSLLLPPPVATVILEEWKKKVGMMTGDEHDILGDGSYHFTLYLQRRVCIELGNWDDCHRMIGIRGINWHRNTFNAIGDNKWSVPVAHA